MTLTLTSSSEMMTNYLQAELIAPQKTFQALQTADGRAALFAIDTSGALNVIQEQSGDTVTGWTVTDLSSAQIARDFPAGGTVSTIEVGQSVTDGSFGLAMVVTSGATNQLYLCLGNSSKDLSWTAAPNWTAYPYDDPSITLSSLEIVNIYLCEPTGTTQYILVDVVRDPSSPAKDVCRFLLDPTRASGHVWNIHDLPIDVEVGGYSSVIGRAPRGYVDGLYTAGCAGTSPQLVFLPLKNVYGSGPALPTRLQLPAVPSAIASMRNTDLSTDLFAVAGTTLYYFASTNQHNDATPTTLLDNEVFSGTTQLTATLHDGVVTLWGRNGSDQVYSTSCAVTSLTTGSAWSVPLPILSGIEQMSPYVNAVDGGNTIFAAGAGALDRITRSTTNGLWVTDKITLPTPPKQPAISFNSYTTTIQVTGDDGLPAANVSIGLAANQRAGVHVNGVYFALDTAPVHVTTSPSGTITIVEATDTLTGTTFTVSAGTGSATTVSPMDASFQKIAQLDTPDTLAGAVITSADGTTRPLVPAGASSTDLATVAGGMGQLNTCYGQLTAATPPRALLARAVGVVALPAELADADAILVDIGDLFSWLESGIDAVIEIIEDAENAVWHFVAEIGEATYTALIDSAEAVVGAAVWLFDQIKTGIEDLIKYVEFLFDWDDIGRTKAVLYNLLKRFMDGEVGGLQTIKSEFDEVIGEVEQSINTWAGITDWSPLGDAAGKPAAGSASNPMQGQNAASQHLSHHFQNNASNISVVGDLPAPDLLKSLVDDLFNALKNEATVLDDVVGELAQLASDFSSLSVEQVLQRLVAILADGVLSSVQVVVDALLDILTAIAKAALTVLDTKIYIPVISDILEAIGVPEISFLDLFCWIGAVSYTVVYKLANATAPFPDNQTTTFLSSASSMDELKQAFSGSGSLSPHAQAALAASPAAASGPVPISADVAKTVFVAGHAFGGFFALMSDFVSPFEAAEESGDNPWGIPSAVLGILGGASVGLTNVLVPRDPIQNKYVSTASSVTTGIRILAKVIFSGPVQKKFAASTSIMSRLAVGDGRATGAIVDAVLVVPALACTGWHFYEIAEESASNDRTDAILEEVSNLTSYISRVAYAVAVNDDDPESRAITIGVMAVANLATAGLQTAEAIVG